MWRGTLASLGVTSLPCRFERSEKSPPCGKERLKGRPLTSFGATIKKGLGGTIKRGSGRQKRAFGGTTLPCLFERSEKSPPCGRERLKGRPLKSFGVTIEGVRGDKKGFGATEKKGSG